MAFLDFLKKAKKTDVLLETAKNTYKNGSINLENTIGDLQKSAVGSLQEIIKNRCNLQLVKNAWGLYNPSTGVGTSADPASHSSIIEPPFLTFDVIDALYRTNMFAQKSIDIVPSDVVRKWRKFTTVEGRENGEDILKKREAGENEFLVRKAIFELLKYAGMYGGAALLIVTKDSVFNEPLIIDKIKKGSLIKFQPVFLGQLTPSSEYNLDPTSIYYKRPLYYNISNTDDNENLVHQSHLIIRDGIELPLYSSLKQMSFGDSKFTAIFDLLAIAQEWHSHVMAILKKAVVDQVGIKDFNQLAATHSDALGNRLKLHQMTLSTMKTLITDAEDSYTRSEVSNFDGIVEAYYACLQTLASHEEMPLTRYLGTSVGGFATGENEILQYEDTIRSKQTELRSTLRLLDDVMEMHLFGEQLDIDYDFESLRDATPSEEADILKKSAETHQLYLNSEVVSPQIVAQQLKDEGIYPAMDDSFINSLSNEPLSGEDKAELSKILGGEGDKADSSQADTNLDSPTQ